MLPIRNQERSRSSGDRKLVSPGSSPSSRSALAASATATAVAGLGACIPIDPEPSSEGVEFCDHHPESAELRPLESPLAAEARVHIGVVELHDEACAGERIDVAAAESTDTGVFSTDVVSASHIDVEASAERDAATLTIQVEDGREPAMNFAVRPARDARWMAANERIHSLYGEDELQSLRMMSDSALRIDYDRQVSGWGDVTLDAVGASHTEVDVDDYWLQVALAAGGEEEAFELQGEGAADLEIQVVDGGVEQLELYPTESTESALEHSDRVFDEDAFRIGAEADTPVAFYVLPLDTEGEYLAGVPDDGPTASVVDGNAEIEEQEERVIVIEGPDGWATIELEWLDVTAEFDFRFFDELPGE